MTEPSASKVESADAYSIAHLKLVRRVFYGRWVAAILIVIAFALLINAFAHGQIAWNVVAQFFTAKAILAGLVNTIIMTICAMVLGIALGVLFAVMARSPNPLYGVAQFIGFFAARRCLSAAAVVQPADLPTLGIPGCSKCARSTDLAVHRDALGWDNQGRTAKSRAGSCRSMPVRPRPRRRSG
jgi:polar amino acid transport system permease protein